MAWSGSASGIYSQSMIFIKQNTLEAIPYKLNALKIEDEVIIYGYVYT